MEKYIEYKMKFNKAGFFRHDGLLSHKEFSQLSDKEIKILDNDLQSQKLMAVEYNGSVEVKELDLEKLQSYPYFKEHKKIRSKYKFNK